MTPIEEIASKAKAAAAILRAVSPEKRADAQLYQQRKQEAEGT